MNLKDIILSVFIKEFGVSSETNLFFYTIEFDFYLKRGTHLVLKKEIV
jgi:hypothetical protein